ncbi:hypothetical protein BDN71DRAFT_1509377 [Pleurotus eryngii]|uniref:Uncharacterized protein n=1 Tax=Pleurotus eryngii TaxID=5323 RepID=A0A9P6DDZ1_PLEER|nr:hypothetical protein BDN71DRAFT_1509377 [Pleurotus eryngii]
MSTIIAYNVSSQQAVTTTFTKLQQQLLAQVAASTEEMKVMKKEEFDALIRLRIETLDEAMRRQMEKDKEKATDMAASGAGKAMEEITVYKIVVPKKCANAKSKSMVSSETNEAGEAGPSVAGPSKPCQRPEPSSDEGEEFLELSDNDKESNTGK